MIKIAFTMLAMAGIFISCSRDNAESSFIPKKYNYPEDSLSEPKTFVYQESRTKEIEYLDLKFQTKSGNKYLSKLRYSLRGKLDSAIISNDRLVELYSFALFSAQFAKADIEVDTVIKNESKLGIRRRRVIYKDAEFTLESNTNEEYLKDTTITWQNKLIQCIVTHAYSNNIIIENNQPLQSARLITSDHCYYGKKYRPDKIYHDPGQYPQNICAERYHN